MRVVISHLRPMCFVLVLSAPLVSVPPPPVFSCGFLSLFSPFLRRAGRGVLCLLASFVAALVPSSRFPHSLRSCPVLACPAGDRPPSSSFPLVVAVASARVSSCPRLPPLPVLRQAWAGRVSGRSCLLVSSLRSRSRLRFPCRACVRAVIGGGWRAAGALAWLLACLGMAAGDVVSAVVVFGLWLACLYI